MRSPSSARPAASAASSSSGPWTAAHQVAALVRAPAKLALTHSHLTVVTGQLSDRQAVEQAVTGSRLDYTIARITNPTDKPATGRIRSGFLGHGKVASAMSRADIAAFPVDQLTDARYRRAMPAISN
ncbi:hypothetical protein OOK27_06370 [Streptomyces canus]|uniref:NAD(P)H-binding protein n=1 Tax=Streptomyces canus TaxID=58343 RepID=UPI0022594CEA|nr:NAD(P)H-binding protein [Streptomyces canus]MCX5253795.1 hypothetical protein [Streptomyces canus]